MKYWSYLTFLCLLIAFASCRNGGLGKGKNLRFEIKTLQKQLGDCKKSSASCAKVDLRYPYAKYGKPEIRKAVNDTILLRLIQNFVFEEFHGQPSEQSLADGADNFLREWQTAAKRDPDSEGMAWELNINGEVGLQTAKVAVVSLSTYSFAGGAHPNSYVSILNFNAKTGALLDWEDFVTDMERFKELAEKKFKEARDLPKRAKLNEEGYFWDGPFELPQNFELQKEGVYFWYNPYEAASYANGPTEFLITFKELGKLVDRNVIF